MGAPARSTRAASLGSPFARGQASRAGIRRFAVGRGGGSHQKRPHGSRALCRARRKRDPPLPDAAPAESRPPAPPHGGGALRRAAAASRRAAHHREAPGGARRGAGAARAEVHLVDALVYVFRAFYSLPGSIRDPAGRQSNALVGFANFLVGYIVAERPTHMALCFDRSLNSSFRNKLYAGYKANRPEPDAAFMDQVRRCRKFAEALGVPCFDDRRYEADDLIATLGTAMLRGGHRCVVVTSDKDLCQLVEPRLSVYDFARGVRYDEAGVRRKLGVRPCQVADLLGLMGDPVDCIPGVRGVGAKTAAALLRRFRDIDAVYAGLDKVPTLKLRGAAGVQQALASGREAAFLSRTLATLERQVPMRVDGLGGVARGRPSRRIHRLLDDFGLRRLHDRVDALP